MSEKCNIPSKPSNELVERRIHVEEILDALHPGTAATNTMLLNAIESLVRRIILEERGGADTSGESHG